MKDGTKTLEQIIREVERARDRAEEKLFEWVCEYEAALKGFETRHRKTLREEYGTGDFDVSKRIEAGGIDVYAFDIDAPNERVKCTAYAIKRLRTLEKRIDDWEKKAVMAEDALDALY